MYKIFPRILFAAPSSGSGKTIVTCGFLSYLKENGRQVTAYKCGPDYIDPMFHRKVIGVSGGNLDTYFAKESEILSILGTDSSDCAVMEGVMGIYDGLGGISSIASSYDLAKTTKTPIVLIVSAKGMGRTLLSLLKGLLLDDTEHLIAGIILNQMSESYYKEMQPHILKLLDSMEQDVALLGFLPTLPELNLQSRHLGLQLPDEIADLKEQVKGMQTALEQYCDLTVLYEIMMRAPALHYSLKNAFTLVDSEVTLAVARDEAFCFYYAENLKLLERLGVTIKEFSPLHDESLPEDVDGILLGGGYPELFAKELSENTSMLDSIRNAIKDGLPSFAECGGFLYLQRKLTAEDGKEYPMVGVIDAESKKQKRLVRFGYIEGMEDCQYYHTMGLRGHEFHYYDSSDNGAGIRVKKPLKDVSWDCLHVAEDHVWGFPHFYYPSNPAFAKDMIQAMKKRKGR